MTIPNAPELLVPAGYRRQTWKNGGGVSTTIASETLSGRDGTDWSDVRWQLSKTEIVSSGPFSDLTGFDRAQTVIRGCGLVLETPTGSIDVRTPFVPVCFDGGLPIVSRLESGPVEVLNLIGRREFCALKLQVLPAGPSISDPGATHVMYAPSFDAVVLIDGSSFTIPPDHAIRLEVSCVIELIAGALLMASIGRRFG